MSKFMEIQKVLSSKTMSDIDSEITKLSSEKSVAAEEYDKQLSALKQAKSGLKAQVAEIDAGLKKQKYQKELVKMMIDSGQVGDMAVGGQMVDQFAGVETEPEAQGLPILNGMA